MGNPRRSPRMFVALGAAALIVAAFAGASAAAVAARGGHASADQSTSTGQLHGAGATASVTVRRPIVETGTSLSASRSLVATVARFTDPNPAEPLADYAAVILWGDKTAPATGTVSPDPKGGFDISGTHVYATNGSYQATVSITDVYRASAKVTSALSVSGTSFTTCTGVLGTKVAGDLEVPAAAACALAAGSEVTGNVTVASGGAVRSNGGRVVGSVLVTAGAITLTAGTVVGGNVGVNGGGPVQLTGASVGGSLQILLLVKSVVPGSVCATMVQGGLTLESSGTPMLIGGAGCAGNHVSGSVEVEKNVVPAGAPYSASISGNKVGGFLDCEHDSPAATGIRGSNVVQGTKRGECAGL